MQTRIRDSLEQVANKVAARSRIPIAVPGPEISEAIWEIFSDVPRIPDYDPTERVWSNTVTYAADEVPPDPADVSIAIEGDENQLMINVAPPGQDPIRMPFEPAAAEELFLAGLAAVAEVRRRRDDPR